MLGNGHVRFGGRGRETGRPKGQHRALPRPNTYLRSWEGFLYLAVVVDAYSRRVVGWAMADHLRTELVLDAVGMALFTRKPERGQLVHHSDRGTQLGFKEPTQHRCSGATVVARSGLRQASSTRGSCAVGC